MKKLLIIGAVLLLCLGLAEAKTRNMYGVKGGVNIAKLQISETDGSVTPPPAWAQSWAC